MQQHLLVDPGAVQTLTTRWGALVDDLNQTTAPAGLDFSCQASAAAVSGSYCDVKAFSAALAARVDLRAGYVAEADTVYLANEAASANMLAAVAQPANRD
ncbi:hypothetical protein [Mycobacterium camsae]|uniref:hypothetical protein n=1 Tax=Mycobacterium gordonae TaxID=1778 RepID=UPI001F120359|nr:hypothetical protein [Mycobacterium gordonae]